MFATHRARALAAVVALAAAAACGGRTGDEAASAREPPSDQDGTENSNDPGGAFDGDAPVSGEGESSASPLPAAEDGREDLIEPEDRREDPVEPEETRPSPDPEPERDPPSQTPPALAECAAPDESGCSACCMQVEFGCVQLSASAADATLYDRREHLGACSPSCRPCSACQRDVEAVFASTVGRSYAECNCNDVNVGIDPCFFPGGCECGCSVFASASRDFCSDGL